MAVIGMANPASVYCVEQGGELDIRMDAQGGQYGVCIFADGTECGEWAYFRGECQPGDNDVAPSPVPVPQYTNDTYGFSFDPPSSWAIEGYDDHVIFRQAPYFLFVGYKGADADTPPFRTGMPAGEFADGGTAQLLGQELPKKLLVYEGKTKVVDYGSNIGVGDLRLFIWLDIELSGGVSYDDADIPAEIIAEADQIIASFMLTSGETPTISLLGQ